VVIAVALFSAVRLAASRGRRWRGEMDADITHVLMGVAMAGMFVPRLSTLPVPAWETVFAAAGLWFGWRVGQVRHDGLSGHSGHGDHGPALSSHGDHGGYPGFAGRYCRHPLPHLIDCVAMMYMLWAVPVLRPAAALVAGSGMSGAAGGVRLPALGLALALCICGYVVWLADRIQVLAPAAPGTPAVPLAGRSLLADRALLAVQPKLAVRPMLAPRVATCCKIAMGLAMGVMLIDLV
jgi:hypothetical protein